MSQATSTAMTRRALLAGSAGAGLAAFLPRSASAGDFKLTAAPATAPLVSGQPETAVWAYNATVPGPEIRMRQGGRARIAVENRLGEDTTVHFHGLRLPNAMDGVPHLTSRRSPRARPSPTSSTCRMPGPTGITRTSTAPFRSGAGSRDPSSWRSARRSRSTAMSSGCCRTGGWRQMRQIRDDFGGMHDKAHNGRVGDTVTINGRVPGTFAVRRGERIRLRLINAANARVFGLRFAGHEPTIVAYDGQPVTPHAPPEGAVVLGPAMRVDLILDMTGSPGERFQIVDDHYRGLAYRLVDIVYDANPLRERPPDTAIALPANTMPEPDVASAARHEVTFNGGMMGQTMMQGRGMGGMGT